MKRRGALKRMVLSLHGLMAACFAIPALRFLLAPLRSSGSASGFLRVAPLASVPTLRPVRVVVTRDRWDAYAHIPPGPIGSVWLMREGGESEPPVIRCFQTICPHLGCGVDYSAARKAFSCPCHASEFAVDGTPRSGPSPRSMDQLACRVTEPDGEGKRWIEVEYRKFRTGIREKRALG